MKKQIALLLAAVMLFALAACGKKAETPSLAEQVTTPTTTAATTQKQTTTAAPTTKAPETTTAAPAFYDPLTGLACDEETVSKRPFGIMINNMDTPEQRVQTSVNDADVVIETYIEGYATRLLAIYKNIDGIGQIGSIRSARLNFAQLAHSFDLIYVHVGNDNKYCTPYLQEVGMDDIDFQKHVYWFREPNGLPIEHTLYTTDELLNNCVSDIGERTTTDQTAPWVNFSKEADNKAPEGGEDCSVFNVTYSSIHTGSFHYDAASKLYERWSNGEKLTDYKTGDPITFTNVFELGTSVSTFDDRLHVNIDLSGGDGYYVSEGKVIAIKWSTDSEHKLSFTKADGSPLTVNAGKTFVNINLASYGASWE